MPDKSPAEASDTTLLELLRLLLDREEYGVALHLREGQDYRYVYANPAFQALRPSVPMLGRLVRDVWGEGAPEMVLRLREVERSGQPWVRFNQPVLVEGPEGEPQRKYYTLYMRRLQLGDAVYVATTCRDVSPEVEAAKRAAAAQRDLKRSVGLMRTQEHESRVLEGANRILEAAIGAETEEALGEACLQVAEQVTGSAFGFIGMVAEDGTLYDIAISNPGWDACAISDQGGHRELPSGVRIAGLYGQVISSGRTVFTNEPRAHPASIGAPEGHPPLLNFLGVPLKRGNSTVGIIAVANRQEGYDKEIVGLLEELSPSITTALYSFRSARDLLASTQLLEVHMTNSPLAIVEFDTAFRITRWSGAAEQIFGWRADEVLGTPLWEIPWVYEPDSEVVQAESSRLHSGAVKSSQNVNRNVRKDGRVIWCTWYSSVIHDSRGKMTSVFSLVQDITDQKDAQERLAIQAARVELLKRIADVSSSALELRHLAERMAAAAGDVTGAGMAAIILLDRGDGQSLISSWGCSEDFLSAMRSIRGSDPAETARRGDEPIYLSDARDLRLKESMAEVFERTEIVSLAWLPLVFEGKPAGGLGLAWDRRHEFDAEERAFLGSLAGEMSVGLRNAMLYEGERGQRQRIQELHGVLEVAVASSDTQEVAQGVLEYLVERRTFDLGSIWLARADALELIASLNYPPEYGERLSPLSLSSEYDVPAVYRSGKSIVRSDVSQLNPAVAELYRSLGVEVGAYVVVPLWSRGQTIGVLALAWQEARSIKEGDVSFYEAIGAEVGVVLRNRELFRERTLEARYAEALNRINEAVHSTLDFDEIMRRVVVEATRAAGFDAAAVHLREAGVWRLAYVYGIPEEMRDMRVPDEQAVSSMWIVEHGQPLIRSKRDNETWPMGVMERLGVGSLLGLPLVARGERIGVLYTGRRGESAFEEQQIDFMRKVASTVSLALENARLYEAERSIADRLQTALLTLPDQLPGIEFARAYHSATEAARVGGDFYDLFEIGEGRIGIIIGDVAGKGMDAAVLTSMVKNTLRAHASTPGTRLSDVLKLTNDVVFKSTPVEAFVTVFLGVLDMTEGTLSYASAGHTEGDLLKLDGDVQPLRVTGPLLGAFPGVSYTESEARFDVGDLLFLYTDGLIEERRGDELFGETRLREILAGLDTADVEGLVSEVVAKVVSFAGGKLSDDLAILAVRRSASA